MWPGFRPHDGAGAGSVRIPVTSPKKFGDHTYGVALHETLSKSSPVHRPFHACPAAMAGISGRLWGHGTSRGSVETLPSRPRTREPHERTVEQGACQTMSVLPQGMVRGLAEVVLRVEDLDTMQSFYSDVIGLTLLNRFDDDMAFFALPSGTRDHPQTLALFSERWQANVPNAPWAGMEQSKTTLHHFSLAVSLQDLLKARELLSAAQVPTYDRVFAWAGWRSLMIADPEKNVVELVASDPSIYRPLSD